MAEGAGLGSLLGSRVGGRLGTSLAPRGHVIPTPATILGAGYYGDWRADDPNRVMNGGNVAGLFNYGLDASDALQATAGMQPTYLATGYNGGPAIQGNTSMGKELVATLNTPVATGGRCYVWLVVQLTTTAAQQYIAGFLDAIPNGAGYNFVHFDGSGHFVQDRGSNDGATSVTIGAADTNRHLLEFGLTVGGLNSGVLDGVGANSTKSGGANGALTKFVLGAVGGGVIPTDALLVRAVAWHDPANPTHDPSAQNLTDMRTYFRGNNAANYTGGNYGLP